MYALKMGPRDLFPPKSGTGRGSGRAAKTPRTRKTAELVRDGGEGGANPSPDATRATVQQSAEGEDKSKDKSKDTGEKQGEDAPPGCTLAQ